MYTSSLYRHHRAKHGKPHTTPTSATIPETWAMFCTKPRQTGGSNRDTKRGTVATHHIKTTPHVSIKTSTHIWVITHYNLIQDMLLTKFLTHIKNYSAHSMHNFRTHAMRLFWSLCQSFHEPSRRDNDNLTYKWQSQRTRSWQVIGSMHLVL